MTNKKRHPRQQVLYKTIQKSICKIIAQGKHIEDNKFVEGYFNDEPTKKALLFFLTQKVAYRQKSLRVKLLPQMWILLLVLCSHQLFKKHVQY